NAVAAGVPLATAVRAATAQPADYLSLPDVGRLAPGLRADLAVLDDDLFVTRVLRSGVWS
ncbi:amidohydrolase family protein, partial [Propionicimonas sp.]|uniref:amidohydrolase family protein n=1 Tax=Propionicimonas sp. TaxID=1955623 RepID=UPI0039E5376E